MEETISLPTSRKELGHLERVNIREVWANEATEFTPWLGSDTSLQALGEAIGMTLHLQAQEQPIGMSRADILAKDETSGNWVLIENQLERTDHTHLGQLVTYASGLRACTIIWIAGVFTDEHKSALTWLNEITHEDIQFFGIEIELWQIGNSPAAPKFNVIVRPNSWTRSISSAVQDITEPAKIRVQRYLREQLAVGRKPTLREIMETCAVAKRTAAKHRDIVFGRSPAARQDTEEEE